MKTHQYVIGTGYYTRCGVRGDALAWFYQLWLENTVKYAEPLAIYVLAGGDGKLPKDAFGEKLDCVVIWTDILGDLGHCGQVLSGEKPYYFCGASATILTLAMLAYLNESDFIFKEQDVLAFGDYVATMYRELGDRGCIFGSQRGQLCANSLFLVRHAAIPEFVRLYLGTPRENAPNQMGEIKYARLERERPDFFCRYSFGVDRERPFDVKAAVWYAQKFTTAELLTLRSAGLVDFESLPDTPSFSNS